MSILEIMKEKMEQYRGDTRFFQDYSSAVANLGGLQDKLALVQVLEKEGLQAVTARDLKKAAEFMDLQKAALLMAAPEDFDSFIQYIEWNREPRKRFYFPRRKQLKPIVSDLQDLADDKLDLLSISMPPGVGKSTLAIFFLCWLAGKYPDEPILTGSHSNSFIRGVYDECLRILDQQGEYLWHDVFPGIGVCNTNAKDCRIDVGTSKRFETLEFTSIGTGNAGLYRAGTLLYCDDLVSGIEVALSKERLDKLWEIYTTDLRQRKKGEQTKELHIATRWSVHDVIGRLERMYENSQRARFIAIPALNGEDESNFNYKYGVGFTTDFYKNQRDIMDDVSWLALYQNQPIEREGLLYTAEELQWYFELPDPKDREPDSIIAVCDTKDKGSDYCVMPIAYQYGQQYYIEDFICDNGNPDTVEARLVSMLLKHHVQLARFESNSAGGRIAQKVQELVKQKGGRTKITTKFTTANKETKIITAAGYVKERFLFKSGETNKEYQTALKFLTGYTMAGKNKHDDVPDALSMLVDFIDSRQFGTVQAIKRPF